MTVQQDILKSGPYNTDGVSVNFQVTFQYLEQSDIVVTLLNTTTGAALVGFMTTDYTVVNNISPIIGGVLTVAANAFGGIANASGIIVAGYTLTITPSVPLLQQESYPEAGLFPSAAVETALDRLTLICQTLQLNTSQSLRYPVTDSSSISNTLPNSVQRAGLLLGFDASGNPIASAGTGSVVISSAMTPVVQASSTFIAAELLLNGNIPSVARAIVDTNIFSAFTTNVNSYAQAVLQNTNSGAVASTDFVINNNLSTATTFFGDFGMNSSGFTGTGSLNLANAVYVSATSGDLVLGTTTANAIHFVVNSNTADAMSISSAGIVSVPSAVITTMNGGPLAGFRNRIMNGDIRIDQRHNGASQTVNSTPATTVDRFFAVSAGASVTGSRVSGSGVDQYLYQFTGAASVTAITFYQNIESTNIYDLEGSVCTLSVKLANSLLTTVNWIASYANSSDTFGTVTTIASGSFTVNSTLTKYSAQITLPANAVNGVQIAFSVGAQISGTWQIAEVQLEQGSVATSFERIPIGVSLLLCQRYLPVFSTTQTGTAAFSGVGQAISTTSLLTFFQFPTPARVPVTGVTINGLTSFRTTTATGGNVALATSGLDSGNIQSADLLSTVASGLVAGNTTLLYSTANTCQIIFTGAEL